MQEQQNFINLKLLAKQAVEGFIIGMHKSPFHGFSVEFAEHKQYNPGDNIKNIDWKVYGRSDKLFIKKFDEETNLRCNMVIDCSSSMHFPENPKHFSKLQFCLRAASSIMYVLKQQQDASGITFFDENITFSSAVKSSSLHYNNLFTELTKKYNYAVKNKGSAITSILHKIADQNHRRSLIIIFTDLLDTYNNNNELFDALQHLKYNKHEVILFNVYDGDKELGFNWENRPYEFIDLETGQSIKLNSNAIKNSYLQKFSELKKEIELKCLQFKIDMVQADINKSLDQILLPYFIKRSKMK